jgi:hypothetical protein
LFGTLASFASTSIFLYLPLFFSVTENHWWRISGDPSILDHSDLWREFLGERLVSFVILVEEIEQGVLESGTTTHSLSPIIAEVCDRLLISVHHFRHRAHHRHHGEPANL